MIGDQSTGIIGRADADYGIVEVMLDRELTDLVDVGIVDLDLIRGARYRQTRPAQRGSRKDRSRCKAKSSPQPIGTLRL